MTKRLTCDMTTNCASEVTYIDDKGYVYCTAHGLDRRSVRASRKLRADEIEALQQGQTVTYRRGK